MTAIAEEKIKRLVNLRTKQQELYKLKQRRKRIFLKNKSTSVRCGTISFVLIYVQLEIQKEREERGGQKKISEDKMAEKIQNW